MIDHEKLRDAALDEAAKADGRMKQMAEGTGKTNMYRTYVYLMWLAERHEEALLKEKYRAGRQRHNEVRDIEIARCL